MTGGYLEVGVNDNCEIVINHPKLDVDANGVGHIVFSVEQARNLAALLEKCAIQAAVESLKRRRKASR